MDTQMDRWTDKRVGGWKDVARWMGRWMDGRINGEGRMYRHP